VLETLNHLQRLLACGVGYRSFTEQYLDSCGIFKDAVLSILATIAKQERIRISERVTAGLERARKEGASADGVRWWWTASALRRWMRMAGRHARSARKWGSARPACAVC
jgi:hypothetical protein